MPPDLAAISTVQFETALLIFLRVTTMLFVFPIISAREVPRPVRIGLGAILTLMIYRLVPGVHLPGGLPELIIAAVSQIVLGMIVGYVASLVFVGIQFAGQLIDLQIGFAVANVINPTTQQQVTIIGEFQLAIATLLFFIINGHHMLIAGIAGSFQLAPLPFITLDPSVVGNIVLFFGQAFTDVFKIAAPVAISLFLANVGFAFMARVAPQMNVFVVGFPIQVGVGLIMIGITMPLLGAVAPGIFSGIATQMDVVLRGLHSASP